MATLGAATHTVLNGGVNTDALDFDVAVNINAALTVSGLLTLEAGLIINITRITSADSPYSVLATDHVIFADTDGGAIECDLPAGVDGTSLIFANTGTSGNDLTLDPNGTEQLYNGGAGVAQTLSDGEVLQARFETTENWH